MFFDMGRSKSTDISQPEDVTAYFCVKYVKTDLPDALVREMQLYSCGIAAGFAMLGDGDMSCRDTIHLICWYLEGRLSPSVGAEIEHHLEKCSDCHLVLDAAMSTLDRYFEPNKTQPAATATQAA